VRYEACIKCAAWDVQPASHTPPARPPPGHAPLCPWSKSPARRDDEVPGCMVVRPTTPGGVPRPFSTTKRSALCGGWRKLPGRMDLAARRQRDCGCTTARAKRGFSRTAPAAPLAVRKSAGPDQQVAARQQFQWAGRRGVGPAAPAHAAPPTSGVIMPVGTDSHKSCASLAFVGRLLGSHQSPSKGLFDFDFGAA
jgi:hypothetical protein